MRRVKKAPEEIPLSKRPVGTLTSAEIRTEIHRIDPMMGRLTDALSNFLQYEAEIESGAGGKNAEEYREDQRRAADIQLEQLAADLGKQRRPLGLYIQPNSPDFDQRIRAETAAGGGAKFPATMGFREKKTKAKKGA